MYRLSPAFQLALVKNQAGGIDYHYQCGIDKGPLIPWLSDEQRERFLAEGIVEEIAAPPPEPIASSDQVAECVAALDGIRDAFGQLVPSTAGRPTCTAALRHAGVSYSNNVIAEAVKQRKCTETNEEKKGGQ